MLDMQMDEPKLFHMGKWYYMHNFILFLKLVSLWYNMHNS